jgi:hypothetical protein
LIWTYSTQAEVFALNNALVAILFYLLYLYARDNNQFVDVPLKSKSKPAASMSTEAPRLRYAVMGCFVSGLSLANQQYVCYCATPFAGWSH